MANEYPYFKFWAKDWSCDEKVKLMPREAKGLYIDMLVHCWIEGSIPNNIKSIQILFSIKPDKFRKLFDHFSSSFYSKEGRFYSNRLEKERDKIMAKSLVLAENGRKGGQSKQANAKQMLKQKPTITESEPESESDTDNKKTNKKEIDLKVSSVFDHYFKTFNKNKAYRLTDARKKLIEKSLKRGHDVETLIAAIDGMSSDTWEGRANHSDIKYAIGEVGGEDYVAKWASYEPEIKVTGGEKAGVPKQGWKMGEDEKPVDSF